MRISALEEYGLRCILALADKGPQQQMTIPEIAEREGLSIPYASKLLSILRKSKLIQSVRGRGGGFCIARPADQINLLEVLTALGGPLIDPDHCQRFSGQLDTCIHVEKCSVHYVLGGLAGYIAEYLSKTTLRDILNNNVLTVERNIESHLSLVTTGPITIDRSKLQKNNHLKPEDKTHQA